MKRLIATILAAAVFAGLFEAQAQGIRRSVIASFGDSGVAAGGIYLSCTAAQPPNSGTIGFSGLLLRQGFQQPPLGGSDTTGTGCAGAPQALFTASNFFDACGERFNFLYADVPEAGTSFAWNFGQNALPPTSSEQNPQGVVFATTGTKIVTLTVSTDSCEFSVNYTLQVSVASFGAFAQATGVDCFDDADGSISLTPVNGTPPYLFAWENGNSTPQREGLTPGGYKFTVTDASGCTFAAEAAIEGPDSIALSASVTVESCTGDADGAINLTASGGVPSYGFKWSNGSFAEDLANLSGNTYSVTVTDAANCSKTLDDLVVLTVCEGFEFDNLITPNGDGANDAWVVPGIENFPQNELEVFTRWGNHVFHQKNYDNSWQGTNDQGDPLPVGAYYYILRLNDAAATVYSGSISILR